MSSSIPIIQSLISITNSSNYCQPITLYNQMQHFIDFKYQYDSITNIIQIPPPYIWFNIEQNKCFSSIKNDIQRSRVTKQGLLSTNLKGNILNKINYQQRQEDIGTIQQTQQCFCVAFAVVKDSCEQFLKLIGSQLRACLVSKSNLIDRSHLKISQLDEISKQIYNKYRVFLIFDTKSQPGRVVCFHSCFYPNVHFKLQRVMKKQGLTFRTNDGLQQIQRGQLLNTYGFLSLDNKKRLLIIKKDDPQLRQDTIIGVWVMSTYYSNRTKKQFSKQDAIWVALLDYYTNPQIKTKLSIISKNKGFLCYFGLKRQKNRIDPPQFYLFQQNIKYQPKWSFSIKNQVLSQTNKSSQIKIEFINSTIVQQRQYSQFSDQTNNYQQQNKMKNQNINRENTPKQASKQTNKNYTYLLQGNQSGLSGSSQSQGKNKDKGNQSIIKSNQQQDEKTKTIKQLKKELEKYKQRCLELQAMNKILMQQKMMNTMMQQSNQYQMMNQVPSLPVYHQYGQMPSFSYPLNYSQVSSQNHYPISQNQLQANFQQPIKQDYFKQPNQPPQIQTQITQSNTSNSINTNKPPVNSNMAVNMANKNAQQLQFTQNEKIKKPLFSFPEQTRQEITFGTQSANYISSPKNKLFVKKSQSYGPQAKNQQIQKLPQKQYYKQKEQIKQKDKIQNNYGNAKKDVRNISFQDSFAQYHSDGQDDGPTFKTGSNHFLSKQLQKSLKNHQFESSIKKVQHKDSDQQARENLGLIKSPQFRKINSLKNEANKIQEFQKLNVKVKQIKKQPTQYSNFYVKSDYSYQQPKVKEIQQISPKSPKRNIEPEIQVKKFPKIQSSNESEQQHETYMKLKQKQTKQIPTKVKKVEPEIIKKQIIKKTKKVSSSDDSDQDLQMKKMRQIYLNR